MQYQLSPVDIPSGKSSRIDETGHVYGSLTVVDWYGFGSAYSTGKGQKRSLWLCQCVCGKTVIVSGRALRQGKVRSCGCSQIGVPKNVIDEAGNRYGKLLVLRSAPPSRTHQAMWVCKCDCGNEIITRGSELRRGTKSDCGCGLAVARYNAIHVGMVKGRWLIIENIPTANGHRRWLCHCLYCGRNVVKDSIEDKDANRSCGHNRRHQDPRVSGLKRLYDSYKRHAEKIDVPFLLSLDDVANISKQVCTYCGTPPSRVMDKNRTKSINHKVKYIYNGIDRLDNSRGYVKGNCVACCNTCNLAKRVSSPEEFATWLCRCYPWAKKFCDDHEITI